MHKPGSHAYSHRWQRLLGYVIAGGLLIALLPMRANAAVASGASGTTTAPAATSRLPTQQAPAGTVQNTTSGRWDLGQYMAQVGRAPFGLTVAHPEAPTRLAAMAGLRIRLPGMPIYIDSAGCLFTPVRRTEVFLRPIFEARWVEGRWQTSGGFMLGARTAL